MKPTLIALALLLFFVARSLLDPPPRLTGQPRLPRRRPRPPWSTRARHRLLPRPSPRRLPVKPADPKPADPKPADPAPVADANKISLEKGMKKVEDSDLEGSLENWAEGKEIDLQKVIKRTGVYVKVWHEVRWTDAKKRERDPADLRPPRHRVARPREEPRRGRDGRQDRARSSRSRSSSLQRCADCHNKYK